MSLADAFERRTAEGAVDDLTLLDEITGEGIAETLTKRNSSEDMYTSIGPVLIAVNPYQQLQKAGDSIYATQVARHYYNHEAHELAVVRVGRIQGIGRRRGARYHVPRVRFANRKAQGHVGRVH